VKHVVVIGLAAIPAIVALLALQDRFPYLSRRICCASVLGMVVVVAYSLGKRAGTDGNKILSLSAAVTVGVLVCAVTAKTWRPGTGADTAIVAVAAAITLATLFHAGLLEQFDNGTSRIADAVLMHEFDPVAKLRTIDAGQCVAQTRFPRLEGNNWVVDCGTAHRYEVRRIDDSASPCQDYKQQSHPAHTHVDAVDRGPETFCFLVADTGFEIKPGPCVQPCTL